MWEMGSAEPMKFAGRERPGGKPHRFKERQAAVIMLQFEKNVIMQKCDSYLRGENETGKDENPDFKEIFSNLKFQISNCLLCSTSGFTVYLQMKGNRCW